MTGVRVKALVWERDSLGWGWWADSILGSYRVFNGSRWRLCGCGDTQGTDAGNEDAAKAAAQADYEARILAALEPQAAPAMAEELVALRAEVAALKARAALSPAPQALAGEAELARAAQDVLDEVDKMLAVDPSPIKYRAPYGTLTRLRAALNARETPMKGVTNV